MEISQFISTVLLLINNYIINYASYPVERGILALPHLKLDQATMLLKKLLKRWNSMITLRISVIMQLINLHVYSSEESVEW